jgi:uncharacterized protein YndB with AHSA1/START domain
VVRLERHLHKPPSDVWRALTVPEELKAWFPDSVEVEEWTVGAPLTFVFKEHDLPPMSGVVLEVDEPHVLAFTWGDETLRFELTAAPDGGTDLVLTDELDRAFAARNAAGWDVCLERLAGHTGDVEWKPLFDHYAADFGPVLGPQEGPPPGVDV